MRYSVIYSPTSPRTDWSPQLPPDANDSSRPDASYATLADALAAFDITLSPETIGQLDRYRQLLWQWNEKLNLTRHTTLEKFVGRDVVDSLKLADHLPQRRRLLDIGSGGGAPGVILAICRPDLKISLSESTQKKARALHAMVDELGLPAAVNACRAEELLELRTFDVLVARAVAPMAKLLYWLDPHWGAFDELLLIKGGNWVEERGEARHRGLMKTLELRKVASYEGLIGESVILKLWRRDRDADDGTG